MMNIKDVKNTINEMLIDSRMGKMLLSQKQRLALMVVYSILRFHDKKKTYTRYGYICCPECDDHLEGWELYCPHCGQAIDWGA